MFRFSDTSPDLGDILAVGERAEQLAGYVKATFAEIDTARRCEQTRELAELDPEFAKELRLNQQAKSATKH